MLAPTNKQQKSQTTSVPAPVGGLNNRDSIANMPPTDALVLDNIFCNTTSVNSRNGSVNWTTGITGWVETVAGYNSTTASKLFAAAGANIYDITIQGAVGAAVVTAQTSARYQFTNFQNIAGTQYLVMVNGADKLLLFDGATWTKVDSGSTPAITGVTTSNLIHVNNFKNRLWFVEKNTFNAWYLPLNAIAGAATVFPLGSLFKLGGSLQAMVSWTIDSNYGVDDYAAFVSTQGEVVVYKGYDPSFAASWALVGVYRIGRPIGRRFYTRVGPDVIAITADGVVSLSKQLLAERSQPEDTLSYKIINSITNDVQSYANNFGWQPILYPIGNKIIINVPSAENNTQYQYVMNTITGAWSTFGKNATPWLSACYETLGDNLYYGGNGVVVLADTGSDDNGSVISIEVKPAFSYFQEPGRLKFFTLVRPIFTANGNITPSYVLDLDFSNSNPVANTSYTSSGTAWNTVLWNTSPWSNISQIRKSWLVANGVGYSASFHMKANIKGIMFGLQSIDYAYEYGGVI